MFWHEFIISKALIIKLYMLRKARLNTLYKHYIPKASMEPQEANQQIQNQKIRKVLKLEEEQKGGAFHCVLSA